MDIASCMRAACVRAACVVFVSARLQLRTSKYSIPNLYTHANVTLVHTHCTRRFITGGTNYGIMKGMGEARAKYNPSAPLIGVASLPAIAGGLQLRRMLQGAKNEDVDRTVLERSPTLQEILKQCTSLKSDTPLQQGHKLKLPTYRDHETHRAFQQDLSGAWIDFSSEKSIEGSVMSYEDLVHMDEARAKKKI